MGVLPDIQAFVIVILGGMGSVARQHHRRASCSGVVENLFVAFFPDPTPRLAYTNAFGLLVLMVVLLSGPHGPVRPRHLRME